MIWCPFFGTGGLIQSNYTRNGGCMMKKNKKRYLGIFLIVVLIVGLYYQQSRNKSLNGKIMSLEAHVAQLESSLDVLSETIEENKIYMVHNKNGFVNSIDYEEIDLNRDGIIDEITLENRGRDFSGDVYLVLNGLDYLIESDFYPPDEKLYSMSLEVIDTDLLCIKLSHFTNGIGSNTDVYLYEYNRLDKKRNELHRIWDSSVLEIPNLKSVLKDESILFSYNDGFLMDSWSIQDVPEDKLIMNDLEHNISYPVNSKIEIGNDNTYITLLRVIRGPEVLAFLEERYLLKNHIVKLDSIEVSWEKGK